MKVLSNTEIKG